MSHIEKKEFEIYRITPPPPEWDLQEYIRQYIQTAMTIIFIGSYTITSRC